MQATWAAAQAPSVTADSVTQPVVLPDSQQWVMHGDATGRDYLVQVSVPDASPPAGGYPVLYVLDGNARFPLVVMGRDSLTLRGPDGDTSPWLIVGIGYPDTRRFNGSARSEDYTPAVSNMPAVDSRGRPVGGAEHFQDFLQNQLLPRIADRFEVDASRRALLGHSYGGLFALYTALTRPPLFSNYIAISPSLWWGNGFLYELPSVPGGVKARVLLGAGAQERGRRPAFAQRSGVRSNALPAMCDNVACFAQWLKSHHPHWVVKHQTFTGSDHGNVMWPAVRALWRFLDKSRLDKSEQ
ncbi:alpha/beta hydrolase [Chromohalobacter canadensis]|uniref:alpha/beta hydrolase n=1 Tax=Chromohalobacter canadensis TaxID=141389 RepID=UPI0024105D5C|nr:alpha/beta hydrolase-fold protein [Chromohalobacter canadensis]